MAKPLTPTWSRTSQTNSRRGATAEGSFHGPSGKRRSEAGWRPYGLPAEERALARPYLLRQMNKIDWSAWATTRAASRGLAAAVDGVRNSVF